MASNVRHLPVLQNWDCHHCSNCCREYDIAVTAEERERIEKQNWQEDPEIGDQPLFTPSGPWWSKTYHLRHRRDQGCIFLSKENQCKIHEKFGAQAKPLACRLFPFLLVPVGDHWRVGLRFGCPSAAENRGKPVTQQAATLTSLVKKFQKQQELPSGKVSPPLLRKSQEADWADLLRFQKVLQNLLEDKEDRVELRLRKCLMLANLCRNAKFDVIKGRRLDEFLELVTPALAEEVPADPTTLPRPSWIGRILFRQLAAMYCRKDRGELRGKANRNRLALFYAGCKFGLGVGKVPNLNARMGKYLFADLEKPVGELPPGCEAALARYFQVKLTSFQFCGPTNANLSFWDGLESLALTYPIILWLTRAIPAEDREKALRQAIHIVDDHFGYNPLLKKGRYKFAMSILASHGELPKLIAWYSR